jgi:O-antigen/teichoic acid export membrane protein
MLLRQTLLYLPAQVIGPLVQFVSIILWTHYLTPEELGVYALITAAQEFAFTGTLFWFMLYTMRYYDPAWGPAERDTFLSTETSVIIGACVGTALAVASLPLFITANWSWPLLGAALAFAVTRTLATQITDRVRTAGDTFTYSVLQILWPVLGLIFGWFLITFVSPTAASALAGLALGQVIALLAAIKRIPLRLKPVIAVDMVKAALRYGLPLVGGGLFVWLANNGIRFVVEHSQGPAAVGLITVGWGLGLRVAAFAAMMVTAAAFPIAMRRMREGTMADGQAQLERNGVLLLAVLAPAAVGLWSISDAFVSRFVATDFQAVTMAVMPWAILAGALRNFRIHFGEQVFLLREKTTAPLINDAIDGGLAMLGAAIGLAWIGLPGAAIGSAIAAFVALVVTLVWGWIAYAYRLPIVDGVKIGFATAAIVAVLSQMTIAADLGSIALAVMAGATVYAAALALLYPSMARALMARVINGATTNLAGKHRVL